MNEPFDTGDTERGELVRNPSLLGMAVRQLREHFRMTPAELARGAGVAESVISRLENGKTRSLHGPNLESIADALHVKSSYLKGLAYGVPPTSSDEVWKKYERVTEEPVLPVNKREAYLGLLDVMRDESDERIRQQAFILLKQVAACIPEEAHKDSETRQTPADWEKEVARLLTSRYSVELS